jgi:hypothetical protein
MENKLIFQGTVFEEIDYNIDNDLNIINPDKIGIKEYNYELTRAFHTIFSHIVVEL